jgi:hypothetical protein
MCMGTDGACYDREGEREGEQVRKREIFDILSDGLINRIAGREKIRSEEPRIVGDSMDLAIVKHPPFPSQPAAHQTKGPGRTLSLESAGIGHSIPRSGTDFPGMTVRWQSKKRQRIKKFSRLQRRPFPRYSTHMRLDEV